MVIEFIYRQYKLMFHSKEKHNWTLLTLLEKSLLHCYIVNSSGEDFVTPGCMSETTGVAPVREIFI